MRYLWTEDTGAGLHFWKLVNQLFFDNESSGLNIVSDSNVELSFVKVFPDGHDEIKTWRV